MGRKPKDTTERRLGTLHSSLIEDPEKKQKTSKATTAPKWPRGDEIPIDCSTFKAIASRLAVTEGALADFTSLNRKTIRKCLNLDGDGTIANISLKSFGNVCRFFESRNVNGAVRHLLRVEFDQYGNEVADWKKKMSRALIGRDERYHLDAALQRSPEIIQAIQTTDIATTIYNGSCNTLWYRTDPVKAAWVTSWRQASALIALLRDRGDQPLEYYGTRQEGHVTDEVAKLIRRTGWIAMDEAFVRVEIEFSKKRLAELLALPEADRDPREEVYLRYIVQFPELKAADENQYRREQALYHAARILSRDDDKE